MRSKPNAAEAARENPPGEVAGVGEELRAARLRYGWALRDVAAGLRIQADHLTALEEGRVDALPAPAYALGFLRAYATALGLDAASLARRFKAGLDRNPGSVALNFPTPLPERGVPTGAVVLVSLVLLVVAYMGWYRLSGDGIVPAEVVPAVPQRLTALTQQPVPPPVAPELPADPSAQSRAPGSAPALASAAEPGMTPPARIAPSSAAAMPLPVAPPPPQDAADPSRVLIRATADDWVRIRDPKSGQSQDRTLKAGDTWPVPAKPGLLLTVGNAGGTELLVDGAPGPSLGPPGAVRRDVPLDPDALKAGNLTAPPTPAPPAAATPKPPTP